MLVEKFYFCFSEYIICFWRFHNCYAIFFSLSLSLEFVLVQPLVIISTHTMTDSIKYCFNFIFHHPPHIKIINKYRCIEIYNTFIKLYQFIFIFYLLLLYTYLHYFFHNKIVPSIYIY